MTNTHVFWRCFIALGLSALLTAGCASQAERKDSVVGIRQESGENSNWNAHGGTDRVARAARAGNVIAQRHMGLMCLRGDGVAKDYEQALYWFTAAAQQGDAVSQWHLGAMYERGDGAKQDYAQALRWFSAAAEQGDAAAARSLGLLYLHGFGVSRQADAAFELFQYAAERGDVIAQGNLGVMYLRGDAAFQDEADPEEVTGTINAPAGAPLAADGRRNFEKALYWLNRAAAQHNADAQFVLGLMLMRGDGVIADPRTAYVWLYQAAERGIVEAVEPRDQCAQLLGEVELRDARGDAERGLAGVPRRQMGAE